MSGITVNPIPNKVFGATVTGVSLRDIGDADFAAGRAAVVRQLLEADPLFHTARGRGLWQDAARRNLRGELG